jgi:hypothetical protein
MKWNETNSGYAALPTVSGTFWSWAARRRARCWIGGFYAYVGGNPLIDADAGVNDQAAEEIGTGVGRGYIRHNGWYACDVLALRYGFSQEQIEEHASGPKGRIIWLVYARAKARTYPPYLQH